MKLQWLRDWWTGIRLARSVGRVSRRMDYCDNNYQKAFQELNEKELNLEELREDFASDVKNNKQLMASMEEALETSRAELRVAEKTVEALVASNKVLTDRWDAESAIEERRRMAASMTVREDV